MRKMFGLVGSGLLCLAAFATPSQPVQAAEKELNVGFFIPAKQSLFRIAFDDFVDRVNETGAGHLRISEVKGPEAIPQRQWCNAVQSGLLDIVGIPPSFCANLVPGVEALDAATVAPEIQRQNGGKDAMRALFESRANSRYLAQYGWGVGFHFFLSRPISSMEDLKGMRIRATPNYSAFLEQLGAHPTNVPRGEIYTAMERGVIEGYVNPMSEVRPMGWHEVSKYRVDPGFYHATIVVLMNNDSWNSLTAEQKRILTDAAAYLEGQVADNFVEADRAEGKKLEDEGFVTAIEIPASERDQFLRAAYDAMWASLIEKSPEDGPRLEALLRAE